jgi:hypothetical protein
LDAGANLKQRLVNAAYADNAVWAVGAFYERPLAGRASFLIVKCVVRNNGAIRVEVMDPEIRVERFPALPKV